MKYIIILLALVFSISCNKSNKSDDTKEVAVTQEQLEKAERVFIDKYKALSKEEQDKLFGDTLVAAVQGDADAQHQLGLIYDNRGGVRAIGVPGPEAFPWFEKSAKQGHTDAQFQMFKFSVFVLFQNLYSTKKSYEALVTNNDNKDLARVAEQARFWTEKLANKGVVKAQFTLAALYLGVKGETLIPVDQDKARFWLEKVAIQTADLEAQAHAQKAITEWDQSSSPSEFIIIGTEEINF